MYAVLINRSATINSRQLIGRSKDADGYGVVALIFALKGPMQETKGYIYYRGGHKYFKSEASSGKYQSSCQSSVICSCKA